MIVNKSKIVLAVGSLVVASLGVLAGGCGGGHIGQLKEAASADLSCPKNRVHVLTKSGKTRDVEACQQNATYRWEGDDWRMVARGTPAAAPAPGAAGAPVMKSGPPGVAPAQPAPVMTPTSTPTGTPSQPPPSSPPPAGGKQI
jgi:hypothetical protein